MIKLRLHKLTGKRYLYHDEDGTVEKVKKALDDALDKHDYIEVSMKGVDSMTAYFTQEVFLSIFNQSEVTIEFTDATTHMLDTLRIEAKFPPNPTEFVITGVLKPYDMAYAKFYDRNEHGTFTLRQSREASVPSLMRTRGDAEPLPKIKRWATRLLNTFGHSADDFGDWEEYGEHEEEVGCKAAYKRASKNGEYLFVLEVN